MFNINIFTIVNNPNDNTLCCCLPVAVVAVAVGAVGAVVVAVVAAAAATAGRCLMLIRALFPTLLTCFNINKIKSAFLMMQKGLS
ncbi:unnamed protein product [Rhizophagus irregularis]|nr:unnamed protein product [Rhizophagus irregularis]